MRSLVVPFTLSLSPAEANTTGTQTAKGENPSIPTDIFLSGHTVSVPTHTHYISVSQGEALGLNTGSEGETLDLETHTQNAPGNSQTRVIV